VHLERKVGPTFHSIKTMKNKTTMTKSNEHCHKALIEHDILNDHIVIIETLLRHMNDTQPLQLNL
jgi:hypothetical protein